MLADSQNVRAELRDRRQPCVISSCQDSEEGTREIVDVWAAASRRGEPRNRNRPTEETGDGNQRTVWQS